ncbi:hypothetical protein SASPL_154462 [Salvia splendens]|uniref:Uncharacterized protein n=1 Tax=Salvia splendens TaxID=180675 RepID=A0A8X8W059_SALSN|nr:hypothetical protein SASPL_154462 [Salvia splendens]
MILSYIPDLYSFRAVRRREDGVFGDYANLRSCGDYCKPLRQNLLQPRTLCQSVTADIGYYCNRLLLDDVGDSVFSTDESTDCSNSERIGVIIKKRSM